jgi:cation diffusion facilitator CzcD-associated flavoprotein CzcO
VRESTAKAQGTIGNPPVLIIGAGPAGVVTGYFLKQAGIAYQIVDRAQVVASTWASLYPSLRLNTTRYFSHMPGRKFPLRWGTFPTGRQYHSYVENYAREHQLNIKLGVEVRCVTPEDGGWRVDTDQDSSWHRVVVLATGRFSEPYTADIPGLHDFKGLLLHAHDYRDPDQLAGLRVMVIGNGPSGLDIAIETGKHNGPDQPTLLSMRTGIQLRRRFPLGVSKHGWILLTRRLPARLREPFLRRMETMGYPKSRMSGIKSPIAGQASGAAATRGPELIHAVQRGEVICVDGPKQVNAYSVTLDDGSTHEIDALVIATGYRPALGFLHGVTIQPDDQGWPIRYNSLNYPIDYAKLSYRGTYDSGIAIDAEFEPTLREVKGYPGLFQVGLYYKGKGAMYNFNVEAEIAVSQIAHYLKQTEPVK